MMRSLALAEIANRIGAAIDESLAGRSVSGVSTDSRSSSAGDLYVALRGERFDGHDFVAAAAARGAVAAVVSRDQAGLALPQLQVADTLVALGEIGRLNRELAALPVVGITGSAGKTTCKEMVAAILAASGAGVLATRGNLNNEIGVPLTLLRLAPEHRFAVVEMGAGRAGDIGYLCRFAQPDIGLVTCALPAHLEGFGSVEEVARTKGELFAGLRPDGCAVINADSEFASLWRQQTGARHVVTFGLDGAADVTARDIADEGELQRFTLCCSQGEAAIELPLAGRHNLRNALGAAAAAMAAGADLAAVQRGLKAVSPVPGRLLPRRGLRGERVIDDSYNANPGAVKAAIDVLAGYSGRRRLVLGNMAELGAGAEALHREVAGYARERGIEELYCVGPWAEAQRETFGTGARAFGDNSELLAALAASDPVEVVLVKGSRSAGLEVVVAQLCGDAGGAA
jgi:UDP-N-acetylmuramoyl-tripeptide--D-alanyl-D-alanine ligase